MVQNDTYFAVFSSTQINDGVYNRLFSRFKIIIIMTTTTRAMAMELTSIPRIVWYGLKGWSDCMRKTAEINQAKIFDCCGSLSIVVDQVLF